MLYEEFLKICGENITYEQYEKVIEPMYASVEGMNKRDFIAFLLPSLKALAKKNNDVKRAHEKTVFIWSGNETPNGCYLIGRYGKVVDVDVKIRTGKKIIKLRKLTEEEQRLTGWDYNLAYDFDYRDFNEYLGGSVDRFGNKVILKWVK